MVDEYYEYDDAGVACSDSMTTVIMTRMLDGLVVLMVRTMNVMIILGAVIPPYVMLRVIVKNVLCAISVVSITTHTTACMMVVCMFTIGMVAMVCVCVCVGVCL